MRKQSMLVLMLIGLIFVGLTGGFYASAQMNIQKVGEEGVLKPIAEAQEKTLAGFAESMADTPPQEAVAFEDISEDALFKAIEAASGAEIFAMGATKMVRSYIKKIKIGPRTYEQEFEPGHEPWRSENSNLSYSPFDPRAGPAGRFKPIVMQPIPPFPPPETKPEGPGNPLQVLKSLIRLKMTSKSGDEYIALAEVAGHAVQMSVGEKIVLPDGTEIIVDGISLDSVFLRSGNSRVHIPFAGTEMPKEEFDIRVVK